MWFIVGVKGGRTQLNIIKIDNVSKYYGSLKVLENLNIEIESKQIICIVGPSGCGKSTILNLLSDTFEPDSGEIKKIKDMKISYVFQKSRLLPWRTLEQNMRFVLECKYEKSTIDERINYWFEQVELKGCESLYPNQLSGGMEQRVALARAFSVHSDLLLMDEPFKGLDEPLKFRMLALAAKLWEKQQNTIIFVTHSIREALLFGQKVVVLKDKPTKVIEEIIINAPHKERRIDCRRMVRLEQYIYSIMDKSNSTSYPMNWRLTEK